MAPNRKKKKPASNPARGFATVSVPSKPKNTDSAAIPSPERHPATPSEGGKSMPSAETQHPESSQPKEPSLQNYSPEELEKHFEEAELQSFVEKYATKCKNDASRLASRCETEKRILRPQATPLNMNEWMPEETVNAIIGLTETEEGSHDSQIERNGSSFREEDMIVRLWTLRDALIKLGFTEQKVEELLKHVLVTYSSGLGNRDIAGNLDEFLEWFALHCSPEELPSYDRDKDPIAKGTETTTSWINDNNEAQVPRHRKNDREEAESSVSEADMEPDSVADLIEVDDDTDESIDPEDFTEEYVSLQSRLYSLRPELFDQPRSRSKKSGGAATKTVTRDSDTQVRRLQAKLSKIGNDVLFDRRTAEAQWRERLNELRKEAAFKRIRENQVEKLSKQASPGQSDPEPGDNLTGDVLGKGGDEELFGDLFATGDTEAAPSTSMTEAPSSYVELRDFGEPTGLSPRRVLEETCRARDPKCKIKTKDLSVSTHSNRKAIEVQWSKPQDEICSISLERVTIKSNAWTVFVSMDSIATPTPAQAEGFVCTLCFFLITGSDSKESKPFNRLPAAWRDLWMEFVEVRKQQEEETNKGTWRYLRGLIKETSGEYDHDVVSTENFRKRNANAREAKSAESGHKISSADVEASSEDLINLWEERSSRPSFQHMIEFRKNLPVWTYKQEILDTLASHQVLIVCSETGSGKSTQIPSFILENELLNGRPCKIYVTEPRRISAISLARRVSEEIGEKSNDIGTNNSLVGYAIRLESKISQATRLIYATTGVVVRMLERPGDFQDISHIILDEVHERTIDSDFLLIVLRRLLVQRPELKVVLMSATVDAQSFSRYLGGASVINIPGRTFPVEVKYLEDAIEMTNYRIGEHSSSNIVEDIDDDDLSNAPRSEREATGLKAALEGYSSKTKETVLKFDEYRLDYALITKLLATIATDPQLSRYSRAILVFMPGLAEIRRLHDEITSNSTFDGSWIIHTLHSSIASEDQEKAFLVPPEGMRKIVIATNIAETGITIPDITAVIDAGKEKVMRYDERRQLSRLVESFISRANAKQRRGRAGRVQEGVCFHLFTRYRHDHLLAEQQTPEMMRLSLQDLVLRVKICNLGDVEQTLLEAMDPPSPKSIRRAIDSLKEVKALTATESLTPLGKQLAKLPLDVLLGKLIIYGTIFKCLDACVSIAAILSSRSPFVNTVGTSNQRDLARQSFKRGNSDLLTVYNAYLAWKRIRATSGANEYTFCRKNFLSPQALLNIEDVKTQLLVSIVDAGFVKLDADEQAALRRARVTGRNRTFFTVPQRLDHNSCKDVVVNSVIAWSFYPKLAAREGKGWRNVMNNQTITVHPTSINRGCDASVQWLAYYHVMQARNRQNHAHETSAVESFAVALLCGEVDFKFYAGVISIDNHRIRFAARDWKQMLALKILATHIRAIVAETVRQPTKELTHRERQWMELWQGIFD